MAIREIMWTVSEDASSILPSTVQNGGVQGEHNATRSIWVIGKDSPLTNPEYSLYVECTDTTGGEPDHQGPLTIEDGKVSVLLPLAWTQYGGVSTMRLVAEKTESKSEKVITLECRVSFDSRPAGPKGDGVMRGFLQAMLDETQAAREAAFYYREAAGSSAREANEAMLQAKAATADARFLMQKSEANVADAAESATTAEEAAETATQAAGSASESELAARSAVDDAQAAARRAEEAAEQAEENGGIDTSEFVKKTDYATASVAGLVKSSPTYGLYVSSGGLLTVRSADKTDIDAKSIAYRAIAPNVLDYAVKVGLTTNTETLTDEEKAAATEWLGAIPKKLGAYKVPYTDANGDIATNFGWTTNNSPYTFALRREGGQLLVGDPTFDSAATPKSYVDGQMADVVKKTDYAGQSKHGVVKVEYTGGGLYVIGDGLLRVYGARPENIDKKDSSHKSITTDVLDYAVKVGITTNTETLTAEEQAAAMKWLGITDLLSNAFVFFTVDGIEYRAKVGMTWQDLIDSEYNPASDYGPHKAFYESQDGEVYYFVNQEFPSQWITFDGVRVKDTDTIIPNRAYTAG